MAGALQGLRKASLRAARGETASSGGPGHRRGPVARPTSPPGAAGARRPRVPEGGAAGAGARVPAAAMATRTQFENSPDVGVFSLLTNRYCLCALGSAENVSGERAGAGAAGRL